MLARANRIVRPDEFRAVMRRGRRASTPSAVYYRLERGQDAPARFGFVVARSVGGAVERNLVKRRLRAAARRLVDAGLTGVDVVARALPGAAERDWASLSADMYAALDVHPEA